jgi:signal peptidase II
MNALLHQALTESRGAEEDAERVLRHTFWIIALATVLLDQATKLAVTLTMPLNGPSILLIPGTLWLTHVQNPGAAFGRFAGAGWPLIAASIVGVVFILSYRARLLHTHGRLHSILTMGLGLALGGAVGNLIDRVRIGQVIDFIDLGWWPIFNIADSAIVVGAASVVIFFLVFEGRRVSHSTGEGAEGQAREPQRAAGPAPEN